MDTWTPIWSKIVDSSLWGEPDYVVKVFMTMLAKKDLDFIVRGNAYEISRWARKDEAEVIKALEILSRPDKRRLEPQDYDGRRIEKVEDGWLILNGEKYREAIRKIKRRAQQAENQRNYRLRKKGKPLPGEAAAIAAEGRGDQNGADAITTEALPVPRGTPLKADLGPGGEQSPLPEPAVPASPAGSQDLIPSDPGLEEPDLSQRSTSRQTIESEEEPLYPDGEPLG